MYRYLLVLISAAITIAASMTTAFAEDQAPQPSYVILETTDGDITIEVRPEWSPLGAAHFLELVNAGYYDGAPWFRVIDGFVAQCGISADPAQNDEWGEQNIVDEPVIQGNLPGYIAFGKTPMPDTRSTHIYINYADNSRLDGQGFSCFARVVLGMDTALGLEKCEYANQGELMKPGGMDKFREKFPDADYIQKAYTIVSPGSAGSIAVNANSLGTEVYIDGVPVKGTTPLMVADVFPGRHRVTCIQPDGRELSGTVVVQPEKIAKIRFLF